MDRTMDGVFDDWSEGVRQGPGAYDEVRRDADARKLRKEVGLHGKGGKWRGMVRTTWEIIGIPGNICLTMGSSPHLRGTRILTVPSQIEHVPMTNPVIFANTTKRNEFRTLNP